MKNNTTAKHVLFSSLPHIQKPHLEELPVIFDKTTYNELASFSYDNKELLFQYSKKLSELMRSQLEEKESIVLICYNILIVKFQKKFQPIKLIKSYTSKFYVIIFWKRIIWFSIYLMFYIIKHL